MVRDKNFQDPLRPILHFCQTASIFWMTASQKQKILKSYREKKLRTKTEYQEGPQSGKPKMCRTKARHSSN